MAVPAFEELFTQIKTNLWLSGIPFNAPRIQLRFYILVVLIFSMLIAEGSFLVSQYAPENFLELTQLAPCAGCGLLSVLKILPIAAKRQKLFDLTKCLDGLYSIILSHPKKTAVVKNEIFIVKILIKYFFVLNMILIAVYNFSSLVIMLYYYIKTNEVVFKLPYALVVPFSTDTWLTWFVVYLYSITNGFICIVFFTTVDALYCVLTSQVCNNFAIISDEMKNLNESNVHLLKELVKNHQYVLKLSKDLEEIFKLPNLFNVLVGSVEICALGFNLTMGDLSQIPGCVLFLLSVLLQILMMSVFGEKLIRESRKVGDAVFSSQWYKMDKTSKKMIFIIIIRSQKQQQLTAYKFSVISYGSFTKIISTSWSYFTILRTVYTPPESLQLE
uniref:Odorant receptor n=1 Tax=Glyphodes pyloalis TaxID=1242752 RepID=A0A6M3GXF3_GLYPY|nr:olfactory receptor [Glyphodes pyloalis]